MFQICFGGGAETTKSAAFLKEKELLLEKREQDLVEAEKALNRRIQELENEKLQLLKEKQRLGLVVDTSEESKEPSSAHVDVDTNDAEKQSKQTEQSTSSTPDGDDDDNNNTATNTTSEEDAAAAPLEAYENSGDVPVHTGGACYLVYESDSSGRLVEYYSMTPIPDAVGRWTTIPNKSKKRISAFKFKSSGTVIIAGCSGGVQGRKNYFSGWCQFVRSACHMNGVTMIWDPKPKKGINVDIWVYTNDDRPGYQSVKLKPGIGMQTDTIKAIACLPKNTLFYDQAMTIDINKWLLEGSTLGGSIRI